MMNHKTISPFYLAVAGTIGVGKTTVAKILAEHFNAKLLEENMVENVFLSRFYQDMKRWAFTSQTFFLLEKIKQTLATKELLVNKSSVIQDTPIVEDVLSYAKAQFILGNMDEAEFSLYTKLYSQFVEQLPQPDLLVYLDAKPETIFSRVKSRQRIFEQGIPAPYLKLLDKLNRQWVRLWDHRKLLRIPTDQRNFVQSQNDIHWLVNMVAKMINSVIPNGLSSLIANIGAAKAVLLCGLPGSGKSTLAELLGAKLPAQVLASDTIRQEIFQSVRFDPRGDKAIMDLRPTYYSKIAEKANEALQSGQKVIIDATNMDHYRLKVIKRLTHTVSKKEMVVVVVKTGEESIRLRMKKIKQLANDKEDMVTAWERVYGYYQKHLQSGAYFWPEPKEGVKIVEYENGMALGN